MKLVFFFSIMALLTLQVSAQEIPDPGPEQLIGRFQKTLMKELKQGLAQGPQNAISVCQSRAPQIAAQLSDEHATIGRATLKPRNPNNVGPQWVQDLLREDNSLSQPGTNRTIILSDGKIGYVKPIFIQQPCLKCHGTELDATVTQTLRERYPQDQATGYQLGEFRGVFWVEWTKN